MTAIAEGGQEIFMVAISALHSGKAGVQVATVQVALNALVKVGPSEPAGPFKPLLLDLNKGLDNDPPRENEAHQDSAPKA